MNNLIIYTVFHISYIQNLSSEFKVAETIVNDSLVINKKISFQSIWAVLNNPLLTADNQYVKCYIKFSILKFKKFFLKLYISKHFQFWIFYYRISGLLCGNIISSYPISFSRRLSTSVFSSCNFFFLPIWISSPSYLVRSQWQK